MEARQYEYETEKVKQDLEFKRLLATCKEEMEKEYLEKIEAAENAIDYWKNRARNVEVSEDIRVKELAQKDEEVAAAYRLAKIWETQFKDLIDCLQKSDLTGTTILEEYGKIVEKLPKPEINVTNNKEHHTHR